MIERFLRYSLARGQAIKAVWMEGEKLVSRNIRVTRVQEDTVWYLSGTNRKTERALKLSDILSCGYARGDDGDPMREGGANHGKDPESSQE